MATAWLVLALLNADPHLVRGRALYEALLYEDSEVELRLARDATLANPDEQREVLRLLASALAAQGRLVEAENAFADLLQRAPDTPDPADVSPKISELFFRAKARVYPRDHVQ